MEFDWKGALKVIMFDPLQSEDTFQVRTGYSNRISAL